MHTRFGHMQLMIQSAHLPFYRELMDFLGWRTLHSDETTLGVGDDQQTSLWFAATDKDVVNDYDGLGMNHLAIHVDSMADVDAVAEWLTGRGIAHLFETPRHRPEFTWQADQTYYQVMFESPDRLLFEVVYLGPVTAESR